jgi:hypothetical protein
MAHPAHPKFRFLVFIEYVRGSDEKSLPCDLQQRASAEVRIGLADDGINRKDRFVELGHSAPRELVCALSYRIVHGLDETQGFGPGQL